MLPYLLSFLTMAFILCGGRESGLHSSELSAAAKGCEQSLGTAVTAHGGTPDMCFS